MVSNGNMGENKYITSLFFWWIVLTFVYLFFNFFKLQLIIGLFVPIGYFNLIGAVYGTCVHAFPTWMIVFPLVLFVIIGGELLLRKLTIPTWLKLLLIFSTLLLLTMTVDYTIWGTWQSFVNIIDPNNIPCKMSLF